MIDGQPFAVDLYAGLGGWTEGLLAEGYFVAGFDIERHVYGEHRYPGHLVIQDVTTLHGSQFKQADLIVASPPCQKYSYMAMPWTRSKAMAATYLEQPDRVAELNALFNACFRIQREACEAAGRHIPLIVENVRGAVPWVGRARWNFGSYYLWGDARMGLYKCYDKDCRKPFTVRMGTIFESSHLALHLWLQIIHLMCASKKGLATRQIQRMLQCSMKTAWFLGHRIREAMSDGGALMPPMGGEGAIIEVDETYVGGRGQNRKGNKVLPKKVVVSLVNRDGEARSFHVRNNVTQDTLWPILATNMSLDSDLMTDEASFYRTLGQNFASHRTVSHIQQEYSRGIVSTNRVEGYFAILKRGVIGVYHTMSERHLRRYLYEFDFRYTNRSAMGCEDAERANRALIGAKGKRLTYATTH